MQKSARVLGKEYGLTAEEMNRVLFRQGFLEGVPGDYSLTEKGLKYAVEKDFHRGNGGYAHYNRFWTTRTFDESIMEELDVTDELIKEIRDELSAKRAIRYAELMSERKQANADFLAKQAEQLVEQNGSQIEHVSDEIVTINWKKVAKYSLIAAGVVGVCYGVYKLTPKVKAWWERKKETSKNDGNNNTEDNDGE